VKEEKELHLLVDRTNFIKRLRREVLMHIPSKYIGGSVGDIDNAKDFGIENDSDIEDAVDEEHAEDANIAEDEDHAKDGSDSADSEFYDSWDVEDGDDDLFLDNVDKDMNDHNEHTNIVEHEDDAGLEYEDLHLSREEYMKLEYKFK
jgi:hypothetical protein